MKNLILNRGRLLWDARGVWQSVIDKEIMVINKTGKSKNRGFAAAKKAELSIKWSVLNEARAFFQENPLEGLLF